MIPSSGGNLPPDPHPIANIPNPQEHSQSCESVSSGNTHTTDEGKTPNPSKNLTKLMPPVSTAFKKPSKPYRNRRPKSSISISDVLPEAGSVTVKNRNTRSESTGQVVASPEDMDTVSGMSTPLIANLPSPISNLAMAANTTSRDLELNNHPPNRSTSNPLTPSKSPCTVNCASLVIPSPVKMCDLVCDEKFNEDQMCDSETEEHDISELEVPSHIDLSESLYAQNPSATTVQQPLKPVTNPNITTNSNPIPNAHCLQPSQNTVPSQNPNNPTVPNDQNKPEPVNKPTGPPSPAHPIQNAWKSTTNNYLSIADRIKQNQSSNRIKIAYYPPVVTADGKRRVVITNDDLVKAAKAYPLHLYGYFLGTSMDYLRVNYCLKRDWRKFGITEVTKSPAGYYYFKFSSEQGMKGVLEGGPWFVNNIPLFVKKWEPDMCLEKVEPAVVPLWVTAHDVPLGLWTDSGICKIMSYAGEPLLMDRVTETRCTEFTGRIGYARMLVDVVASSNLPTEVEVEFPSTEYQQAKVA